MGHADIERTEVPKLRSGCIEDEVLLLTFAATAGESVRRLD
jgi:hypothetical protein